MIPFMKFSSVENGVKYSYKYFFMGQEVDAETYFNLKAEEIINIYDNNVKDDDYGY
jgi:hypothetical protein